MEKKILGRSNLEKRQRLSSPTLVSTFRRQSSRERPYNVGLYLSKVLLSGIPSLHIQSLPCKRLRLWKEMKHDELRDKINDKRCESGWLSTRVQLRSPCKIAISIVYASKMANIGPTTCNYRERGGYSLRSPP